MYVGGWVLRRVLTTLSNDVMYNAAVFLMLHLHVTCLQKMKCLTAAVKWSALLRQFNGVPYCGSQMECLTAADKWSALLRQINGVPYCGR